MYPAGTAVSPFAVVCSLPFFPERVKSEIYLIFFPPQTSNYCEYSQVYIDAKASCFLKSKSEVVDPNVLDLVFQKEG